MNLTIVPRTSTSGRLGASSTTSVATTLQEHFDDMVNSGQPINDTQELQLEVIATAGLKSNDQTIYADTYAVCLKIIEDGSFASPALAKRFSNFVSKTAPDPISDTPDYGNTDEYLKYFNISLDPVGLVFPDPQGGFTASSLTDGLMEKTRIDLNKLLASYPNVLRDVLAQADSLATDANGPLRTLPRDSNSNWRWRNFQVNPNNISVVADSQGCIYGYMIRVVGTYADTHESTANNPFVDASDMIHSGKSVLEGFVTRDGKLSKWKATDTNNRGEDVSIGASLRPNVDSFVISP